MNFWLDLPKPFTCLAPMDDVTDTVFRQMVERCARPDVFFTEFVNVEGLCSAGRSKLLAKLLYDKSEHPIVAQVWGKVPENYYNVAKDLVEMGFDGIDINMGCPVKDVVSHGCGAALIDNPTLAGEIIEAVQHGIKETKKDIPVSVKTRIGFKSIITESWIAFLLDHHLDALTVHGRTAREMSKVPANWEEIARAVRLRDQINQKTVIIGNGDVKTRKEITDKFEKYKVDGVMIGRGIFSDMFVFSMPEVRPQEVRPQLQMKLMREHIDLFLKTWGKTRDFSILKKFFKIYISGFENAGLVREAVMATRTPEEVEKIMINAGLFK
jgi:tRNA-dihydrouridine synthase